MTDHPKDLAAKHVPEPTPQQADAAQCVMCDWVILLALGALLAGALVIML